MLVLTRSELQEKFKTLKEEQAANSSEREDGSAWKKWGNTGDYFWTAFKWRSGYPRCKGCYGCSECAHIAYGLYCFNLKFQAQSDKYVQYYILNKQVSEKEFYKQFRKLQEEEC